MSEDGRLGPVPFPRAARHADAAIVLVGAVTLRDVRWLAEPIAGSATVVDVRPTATLLLLLTVPLALEVPKPGLRLAAF